MKRLLGLLAVSPAIVSAADSGHPADRWEFVAESGYLWNIGNNTPIDYEIIPTQLTLRSPAVWTLWEGDNGERLSVRNRFSALFESFAAGPEDYYLGIAGAPSVEYWFPSQETSVFFSLGGGVGWTNSTDVTGGMGQDLTFNWFSQLGLRQKLTEDLSLLGGLYFIHHSNLGLTDPNPGIDALGFTVGLGFTF